MDVLIEDGVGVFWMELVDVMVGGVISMDTHRWLLDRWYDVGMAH